MDDQIRARFAEFAEAWNAHDVASMAACWTEGGNLTHPWGSFAAGRAEIIKLLTDEHQGPMRESRWIVAELRIRPLSERTAVVRCDATLENVRAPNGSAYELPHEIDAVVALDQNGQCRFVSFHPSFSRARG